MRADPTLDTMDRPRLAEVDLDALAHNYAVLQRRAGPGMQILPALKANAYGHGIRPVAGRLAQLGVRTFSTGSLEDARKIQEVAPDAQVVMFGGPLPAGIPRVLAQGVTPTVHSLALAQAVSDAATRPTGVYVKVDAGLGRLGVSLDEALELIGRMARLPRVFLRGVYTHLPFQGAEEMAWARARLAEFDALLAQLTAVGLDVPVSQSLASSALLAGIESRTNAVCPGYALFGISPPDDLAQGRDALRPVLRAVRSRLIQVHVPRRPRLGGAPGGPVGVLPLGLADGYPGLRAGRGAQALVRGHRVPLRGVSLEYTTLDLSLASDAAVGDEVVLLGASGGDRITLDELARWHDLRPHQLLMTLDGRLPVQLVSRDSSAAAES